MGAMWQSASVVRDARRGRSTSEANWECGGAKQGCRRQPKEDKE
jgi:hypothetical protein